MADLDGHKVNYSGHYESKFLSNVLSWVIPIGIFFLIWRFAMKKMGPGMGVMSFGKSKAKLFAESATKVTFADVAGIDEAKEELQEVVEFFSTPEKFKKLGGRIPKGVLLVGPPGTGKTLLARAVSGEAEVPFFSISGCSKILSDRRTVLDKLAYLLSRTEVVTGAELRKMLGKSPEKPSTVPQAS